MSLPRFLKCLLGRHDSVGCKCSYCGSIRDTEHDGNGCSCLICGQKRDGEHDGNGCSSLICGRKRDAEHDWDERSDSCSDCDGQGYTLGGYIDYHLDYPEMIPCSFCDGSGRISAVCRTCGKRKAGVRGRL